MERYLKKHLKKGLSDKIVLLTGPRQAGKTFLSKSLFESFSHLNYDLEAHRVALKKMEWDKEKPLVIFDELHKMKNWKGWLKGIYDTQEAPPSFLVTGSAKLNTYKKMGDSLAGRFFQYRLYPLDLKEIAQHHPTPKALDKLLTCSGFPEPFLKGNTSFYKRWQRSHLDIILRQDLLDLQPVRSIVAIETLIELLRTRVGGTVSYANLARDLDCDATTVKRWLEILESMYIIFKLTPYSEKIIRSLKKEPKYYFYDTALVEGDLGAKLENLVAVSLQKELHFLEDTEGLRTQLHFLRTKEGHEVDFLVIQEKKATHLIEVKWKDTDTRFQHFLPHFGQVKCIQLVKELSQSFTSKTGIQVENAEKWLSKLNLKKG